MKIGGVQIATAGALDEAAAELWETITTEIASLRVGEQILILRAFQSRSPWHELPAPVANAMRLAAMRLFDEGE